MDLNALTQELADAFARRRMVAPLPSARDSGFDLAAAYAVEAELTRRRRASGRSTVGRKVGYANKAVWRALKLETVAWAHMYDDTVVMAGSSAATLRVGHMCSPKIEPEIVFKLKEPVDPTNQDPAAVLGAVEWTALGFEVVDSVYADWKFQPSDFVAAYGLHAALIVGEPRPLQGESIAELVEQLAQFRVRLLENGAVVAEGGGKNVLKSPALCLGELAAAIVRHPGGEPLSAGELITTGTLTESRLIHPSETWSAEVEGIELAPLTVHTTA